METGKIIISTEIDNSKLNKGIKDAEREIKSMAKRDEELLKQRTEIELNINEAQKNIKKLKSQMESLKSSGDSSVSMRRLNAELFSAEQDLETVKKQYKDVNDQIIASTGKQEQLTQKIREMNDQIQKNEYKESLKGAIQETNKGVVKTIKNVAKWGVALLGVRTIYGMLSSSLGTISQYNETLSNQITNMKYSFAMAFEPIIMRIVDLVYKLMQYVNYLSQAWFGVSVFANKAAKSSKAASKSLSAAGFDELNTVSGGDSGGGGYTPTGIEPLADVDAPKWLKWLAENKDLLILALGGIALGVTAVAIAMLLLNAANPMVWLTLLIAGVITLAAIIISKWDEIKGIFGSIKDWISQHIIEPVREKFEEFVTNVSKKCQNITTDIKNFFKSIPSSINSIINQIKTSLSNLGDRAGEIVGGAFKSVINFVISGAESLVNSAVSGINKFIGIINEIPGVNIGKLQKVKYPRLASGGIVSQPGKGVNIGGAIAGESGREAVIPLQDSASLAMIGETIGRYVNINNIVNNNMDGRRINRRLQASQKRDNIMMNGAI